MSKAEWVGQSLGNFWSVFFSAEWFANVGLPLLLAILAIVIAWRSLGHQIGHDRKMVREERRRSFAMKFAGEARSAARELELLKEEFTESTTVESVQKFVDSVELITVRLDEAEHDLRAAIGEGPATRAAETISSICRTWMAVIDPADPVWVEPGDRRQNTAYAVRLEISEHSAGTAWYRLTTLARLLDSWDGAERQPQVSWEGVQLVPITANMSNLSEVLDAHMRWAAPVQQEARDRMREMAGWARGSDHSED
ncbi:hypothetical protein [Rhodococcus opacus]|uniref:Uncharacterized protein n=1 Tax=Rhodococcus opacus TaxID=37919 RepID=A0AAX3YPQ2_RHOOP|nr:hypothetical protein [Rhodococcus opacus]WLF51492.1 hypothetical protein Q5707_39090 [Rhodococcus opacus]